MTAASFQVVDVTDAGPELEHLHRVVVRHCGRVEFAGGDGESSVLISKKELASLERAIALLSATEEVRELSDAVAQMAHQVASS